jgi:hypothetical protein
MVGSIVTISVDLLVNWSGRQTNHFFPRQKKMDVFCLTH